MGRYKRRPRLKRFDYTGCYRYFITICTQNKNPVFHSEEVAKQYIGLLAEKAIVFHFKVWVYCFMPDHVHFLAEGTAQDADLKKFVSSFKQITGYHFSLSNKAKATKMYGRANALGYGKMGDLDDVAQGFSPAHKAKLWQPSFYDHVLRKDEDLLETVKYILNNPVRKKIEAHYLDYQLSGSFELDGKL
jgi:putative transposase